MKQKFSAFENNGEIKTRKQIFQTGFRGYVLFFDRLYLFNLLKFIPAVN